MAVKLSDIGSILNRLAGATRGASVVLTDMIMMRSCSTLLCLRLCISDEGAISGSLVRKIAVPGTRTGLLFASMAISPRVEIESRCVLAARSAVPRTHVHISRIDRPASSSGTKPPSKTFARFATRKAASIARKKPISGRVPISGQRHSRRTTKKASDVVTTMVPVTAIP